MNGVGFAGSRQPCIPTSGSFGGPIARGVAGRNLGEFRTNHGKTSSKPAQISRKERFIAKAGNRVNPWGPWQDCDSHSGILFAF
jgi:hypothetical protein